VLSSGELVEQGSPAELAAAPDGSFSKMVAAAAAATGGSGSS
jgi:ABC-type multidrug transport system fused ATPase/permease subunit